MSSEVEPLVVVAAEPAVLNEVGPFITAWGCRVVSPNGIPLADLLAAEPPSLILLDPAFVADGGEQLIASYPEVSVILMTGGESTAVPAIAHRANVFDHLVRPFDPYRLRVVLAHAIERRGLLERIRSLEQKLTGAPEEPANDDLRAIDRMEKRAILDALGRTNGNVRAAAKLLGFGQATVYRKIKRYGIEVFGRRKVSQ